VKFPKLRIPIAARAAAGVVSPAARAGLTEQIHIENATMRLLAVAGPRAAELLTEVNRRQDVIAARATERTASIHPRVAAIESVLRDVSAGVL